MSDDSNEITQRIRRAQSNLRIIKIPIFIAFFILVAVYIYAAITLPQAENRALLEMLVEPAEIREGVLAPAWIVRGGQAPTWIVMLLSLVTLPIWWGFQCSALIFGIQGAWKLTRTIAFFFIFDVVVFLVALGITICIGAITYPFKLIGGLYTLSKYKGYIHAETLHL
jgi:hypothetical protein